MYNNIGGKIKKLSKTIAIIEAGLTILMGGSVMFTDDEKLAGVGVLIITIGCLAAWISSWLLYGFGELIENTGIIARNSGANCGTVNSIAPNANRREELYQLYSKGIITEAEYQKALAGGEQG